MMAYEERSDKITLVLNIFDTLSIKYEEDILTANIIKLFSR